MLAMRLLTSAWCLAVLCAAGCTSAPVASDPREAAARATATEAIEPTVEPATVLVTERGRVYAWGPDLTAAPKVTQIPGDLTVRAAVRAPWGKGILLLVDDWTIEEADLSKRSSLSVVALWGMIRDTARTLDWSSKVLWLDPWTGVRHTVFDSRRDRWGAERMIEHAARATGTEPRGMADNDLTDLFCDDQGTLFFRTEDGNGYRLRVEGARVRGIEPAPSLPDRHLQAERAVIGGHEGLALR